MQKWRREARRLVMWWQERVLPWRPAFFEHISKRTSNLLCHNCPTLLSHSHTLNVPPIISHECPIPISLLCLTSHFMCVQFFHVVSIDVPAGVGAPPLNTTSSCMMSCRQGVDTLEAVTDEKSWGTSCKMAIQLLEVRLLIEHQYRLLVVQYTLHWSMRIFEILKAIKHCPLSLFSSTWQQHVSSVSVLRILEAVKNAMRTCIRYSPVPSYEAKSSTTSHVSFNVQGNWKFVWYCHSTKIRHFSVYFATEFH